MQGAYVFGEPDELDRNVSISLEMPEFQIGFIDMEAGIVTFKGILNFSARSNALIFCMSDMLIFARSPFADCDGAWGVQARDIREFSNNLVEVLLSQKSLF